MEHAESRDEPRIRAIEPRDDDAVASVIRTVMPEYGASGPGFAISDPEVDFMSRAYVRAGCAYFVVELEGRVVGGGGVAQALYEKLGFRRIAGAKGATGHHGCDRFYEREL